MKLFLTENIFIKLIFLACLFLFIAFPPYVYAQESSETFYKAKVTQILDDKVVDIGDSQNLYQHIKVAILDGDEKGKEVELDNGGQIKITQDQKVKPGDIIFVSKLVSTDGSIEYYVADTYRIPALLWLLALFLGFSLLVAGKKGFGALAGLAISFAVIIFFIVPQILAGRDPLLISIVGSLFILLVAIYLAHGFNKQTTVAVIATLLSLIATGVLAFIFVRLASLTGLGSDEAYQLQLGPTQMINLRGLLLGGIIIGALGVMDDITTTQAAAVFELHKTDPKLSLQALIKKSLAIGREHVTSLVNTLVLAYAGTSLPIFILFVLNPKHIPLEMILNSEIVAEEVVTALVGSIGLVLAVPLVTIIAAWYTTKSNR